MHGCHGTITDDIVHATSHVIAASKSDGYKTANKRMNVRLCRNLFALTKQRLFDP